MRESKKAEKIEKIIDAAEEVFSNLGFKNAKMEDIAEASEITKVTLYSYFQSKENLYMAITHRAMETLNFTYAKVIKEHEKENGLEVSLHLIEAFMGFCEENYLYSEALLDYFSLIRSGRSKFTDALKESVYFKKAQDIQNVAFKYVIYEIERGKKDGSIKPDLDSSIATLIGWTSGLGYAKVISATGSNTSSLLNVDLKELKRVKIEIARNNMNNKINLN
jgi:AcrR family transcriptional regulator